jgi:hypothetical protein
MLAVRKNWYRDLPHRLNEQNMNNENKRPGPIIKEETFGCVSNELKTKSIFLRNSVPKLFQGVCDGFQPDRNCTRSS